MADTKTTAWLKAWKSVKVEEENYKVEASQIEGEIPDDFAGTLYRNGPALFEMGDRPLKHPLDGDGLVCAWTFPGDGTVNFRNRFVRTESHLREQAALSRGYTGGGLKAGLFGSESRDGLGKHLLLVKKESNLKNCANTNVIHWAGRLLALFELGGPIEMDRAGLNTVGETRIANTIVQSASIGARPRYDPVKERLILFRYNLVSADSNRATFYEYDSNWKLQAKFEAPIPGHAVFHDIAITRSKYVLHQAPTAFDAVPFGLGLKAGAECISFDGSKPAVFHVVPRDGGDPVSVEVEAAFVLHIANAFDDDQGNVIADVIQMPRLPGMEGDASGTWQESFDFGEDIPPAELVRWTISPTKGTASKEVMSDRFQAFPAVNPYVTSVRHGFVYTAAASGSSPAPPQSILKLDTATKSVAEFSLPGMQFCSEPVMVPRLEGTSEDDGYLLTQVYDADADTSSLVILDASDLAKGPVARIALRNPLPVSIYGTWADGVVPTAQDFAKGRLAASFKEKEWNEVGGGLSLL